MCRLLKPEILTPVAVGLLTYVLCAAINSYYDDAVCRLYEESMRLSLFTGFFTLSGFLLSAKTFLVLNMKKEVYSTAHYLRSFRDKRKSLAPSSKSQKAQTESQRTLEIYKPLKEIGDLLIANVAMTLTSAVLQFSIGLLRVPWIASICLSFAAASASLLFFSLWYMSRNLNRMYEHFESEAEHAIEHDCID